MAVKYTGILRSVYSGPRRMIDSLGRRIEFIDGVAHGIPEYVAQHLLRQNLVSEIIPEVDEDEVVVAPVVEEPVVEDEVAEEPVVEEEVVEEPVVEDEVVEDPVVEEDVAEEPVVEEEVAEEPIVEEDVAEEPVAEEEVAVEEEEISAEEEPSMEFEPVEDNPETSDGVLTRSEVQDLYDRLGTWTAVAEELDISTTTLRKYRDELGL